jgi:phage portal protein BeeE
MLLGIPGDNTYANTQEANGAFWRQTVLPLCGRLAEAIGGWRAPAFGDGAADGGFRSAQPHPTVRRRPGRGAVERA